MAETTTHPITEYGTTRCPRNGGIAADILDGECSSCGEPIALPAAGEGRAPRVDLAKWLWERYAGTHATREKTSGTWEAASERQPWIDDADELAELLPSAPVELRELLVETARHLRRLPESSELADVRLAERLEAAVAGETPTPDLHAAVEGDARELEARADALVAAQEKALGSIWGADDRRDVVRATVAFLASAPPVSVETGDGEARERVRGLLLGEPPTQAEGLSVIQHDDELPRATPTYLINLNIGWADKIIAERMYLNDALGIAHALAAILGCTVDEPAPAAGDGAREENGHA